MVMRKLTLLTTILLIASAAMAVSEVPKDTLNACFSTFIDQNSKASDNSGGASMRITSKSGYFRYGIMAFDMKDLASMREKVELGVLVYSSTSDDYFKTGTGDFPLAVYAMTRKPALPTSFLRFFNTSADDPAGDGFAVNGTYPKSLDDKDGYKLGVITVTKADESTFLKLDVTDFINRNINGSDSVFFFLTSDAAANGTTSLWIRSKAYGPVSAPKLYCYDEKALAVMQGGRNVYVGEKDSVKIFFPPTAVAPFSVTYTDGTTPVTVNDIRQNTYAFEVAPSASVTYNILSASDANGSIAVDGSAVFNVLTPSAALSGVNKIYQGQSAKLTVAFGGIAPFGFTYNDHTGTPVTVSGINTNSYEFEVTPSLTHAYVLTGASDKNNASINVSGSPVVTVIESPVPVLTTGAADWRIMTGDEFGTENLNTKMWTISSGNPVLQNDELRLPVEKNGASYLASQLRLTEAIPNNSDIYLEARIKPLDANGAHTSFSTQTYSTSLASKYKNRYAMSFPYMTYRSGNEYDLYYNLEDWKTNYYVADIDPNKQYFAVRDSLKAQSVPDFKVFGVAISTRDIIYYVDGVEVKRASDMENYNSGALVDALMNASVGSSLEDVAQKAYGYYGQDGWNYNAGYAGDMMALLLGTSINTAEVDASIEGKYAAVDYFRIFKKESDQNEVPAANITFDASTPVTLSGNAEKSGKSVVLRQDGNATFNLGDEYELGTDGVGYFSTIISKGADAEFVLSLLNASGTTLAGAIADQYNQLQTGFGASKLYYASTVSAQPTGRKSTFITNNEATLLVGRIETSADGDDYMSISMLPVMDESEEPFFYPNIEGDYGHTSLNNGWDLNYRYEAGADKISKIRVQSNRAESSVQKFLVGSSFRSVLPKESFATFAPNVFYVNGGTQVELQVELKGAAPWNLTYSDGSASYTINNITTSSVNIPVAPAKTTTYTLTGLTDGNGLEGIVFGKQLVKVKSDRAMTVYPSYDSFINDNAVNTVYFEDHTGNIKKSGYAREAFFRFDISEFGKKDSIDMGSFSVFFNSNDKGAPVVLSVYGIEGGMPGDIVDLCWANKPDEVNYKFITETTLPNPGFTGVRGSWDISGYVNRKLRAGAGTIDLCVKSTGGETTSLLTWRQYVADSVKWENQFPLLELDPYVPVSGLDDIFGNGSDNGLLKVYPNPVSNGYFFVDVAFEGEQRVELYNLAGVLVRETAIVNRRVDVSGLAKGTYMLRVNTGKESYYGKLLIL